MFRLASVRRFLFRTVSQIGVNYRNSPLSAGAAGAVRGGDRLPWVETEPGKDNFAPLASLTWQVHVYGELRGEVAEVCAELRLPLHLFAWQQRSHRPAEWPSMSRWVSSVSRSFAIWPRFMVDRFRLRNLPCESRASCAISSGELKSDCQNQNPHPR